MKLSSRPSRAATRKRDAAESPHECRLPAGAALPWYRSTLAAALGSSGLLFASFPPLDLGFLAWIAPIFWLRLIERPRLTGRRPYMAITLAGFVFWMAALHWLRLPHWMTSFGWIALSAYLSLYVTLFVLLSRIGVHRLGISVIVAAPIVWTGLELARAHLLTGFLMAALGHTQYRWIELIQISDLGGAYTVSLLVMLVAACISRMLPLGRGDCVSPAEQAARPLESATIASNRPMAWWPAVPLAASMSAALAYGYWQTNRPPAPIGPKPKIALIQGTIDTQFDADYLEVKERTLREYLELSVEAVRRAGDEPLDLIVWPESMFRYPLVEVEPGASLPEEYADAPDASREILLDTARQFRTPMLLGLEVWRFTTDRRKFFCCSVLVDYDRQTGQPQLAGKYHKLHPVLFGEYVPLGEKLPWLYDLVPLDVPLTAGEGAEAFSIRVGGPSGDGATPTVRIAPAICFESVLPHVIRGQLVELRGRGEEPDILITQTNDGWFWGSSALDMHLICGVFRAVELRKPFLTAANTGISASIDSHGRILERGPRRAPHVILTTVDLDRRISLYSRWGDWLAGSCLLATLALAAVGIRDRLRRRTIRS